MQEARGGPKSEVTAGQPSERRGLSAQRLEGAGQGSWLPQPQSGPIQGAVDATTAHPGHLPTSGLAKKGQSGVRGLEAHPPEERPPLSQAPLVYTGTLVTHLLGCNMGQMRWRSVLSRGQGTHHGRTIMVAAVNCCY